MGWAEREPEEYRQQCGVGSHTRDRTFLMGVPLSHSYF